MPYAPDPEQASRSFVQSLGELIVQRDFAGLHARLAPRLQSQVSVTELQAFIEKEIQVMRELRDGPEMYPDDYEASYGSVGLADLLEDRGPGFSRADSLGDFEEITPENFRHWMNLALLTSDEDQEEYDVDGFYDLWMVVVEHEGQLRAAYFEIHDLD